MSTLTLLPLVRVADGVQPNEDWRLAIAFYLEDGVTPISLEGLTFAATIGAFATISSSSGQISIAGAANNTINIVVLAENKASWPIGVYPLTLTAGDGAGARDIFANSTLTIGAPQVTKVSLVVAPDTASRAIAAPLPVALAQAFQALQPNNIASALANLSVSDISQLAQAIFSSLPVQSGATAPANTGQAFINSSGYVVIAQ